jgi:hypothetical protein
MVGVGFQFLQLIEQAIICGLVNLLPELQVFVVKAVLCKGIQDMLDLMRTPYSVSENG